MHFKESFGAIRHSMLRDPKPFLLLVVVHLLSPRAFPAQFAGGDGSSENPWQVTNWIELSEVRNNSNRHYELVNDLDSNSFGYDSLVRSNGSEGWEPIYSLSGSFDGKEHTIRDLTINRPEYAYCGLFGNIYTPSATVKNLRIQRSNILGKWYVGGIAGHNNGRILNSSFEGQVSGNSNVGGLTGYNNGIIAFCFSRGTVLGIQTVPQSIGGFVGYNSSKGSISDCYSSTSVEAYASVGGLVGINTGSIKTCLSTGFGYGTLNAGLFVGYQNGGTCTNCFCLGSTPSIGNNGGQSEGISSLAEDEMRDVNTFTGWDFQSIWTLDDNEHPRLRDDLSSRLQTFSILAPRHPQRTRAAHLRGGTLWLSSSNHSGARFSILNASGALVAHGVIAGNNAKTGLLPKGVYSLRLEDGSATRSSRITAID